MMSLSIGTTRSSLLAEARQEWLQTQQNKSIMQGKRAESAAQAPSDAELIALDAQLRQEIAKLQDTSEQVLAAAAASQASGSRVNIMA